MLLLGATDLAATNRLYVDRGLAVAKSFGRKYVEFATPSSPVKLALYGRRAPAKDAGIAPDGTGSHRLMIGGDAGPFTRTGSRGSPHRAPDGEHVARRRERSGVRSCV